MDNDQQKIFSRLYDGFFRSGLAAELGAQRSITLLTIASYMDEDGLACPGQDILARDLGLRSRKQVGRRVQSLLEFRWEGQPIIQRKMVPVEGGKRYERYSVYKILPISQVARFTGVVSDKKDSDVQHGHGCPEKQDKDVHNGQECPINNITVNNTSNCNNSNNSNNSLIAKKGKDVDLEDFQIKNSRDFCIYFAKRYEERYEVPYTVNWQREASMVKNKLLGAYSPDQLRAIIDVVMGEYDTRWGSRNYPRPTIGQLCTWLANKAITVVQEREKKEAEMERQAVAVLKDEGTIGAMERWLDR